MTCEQVIDKLDAHHAMVEKQERDSARADIGMLRAMLPDIAETAPEFLPEAERILLEIHDGLHRCSTVAS